MDLPSISVLIPTLNARSALTECLPSITKQDYPKDLVEVIIADGGSTDGTVELAKSFGAVVVENPLKTGEAGKAAALRAARNDLVALIDSDNILPHENWFREMTAPFSDPKIIGSEPWEFRSRAKDGFVSRYTSQLGANDPYCYFTGVYDRKSVLSGKWTAMKVAAEDRENYIVVSFDSPVMLTIGANGTFWRRRELLEVFEGDYFFDVDIPNLFIEKKGKLLFAKVKTSITHNYCGSSVGAFIKKQKRRIDDLFYHGSLGQRKFKWGKVNRAKALSFIVPTVLSFPLLYQALLGYRRTKDKAWFFHPVACWLTLLVYAFGMGRFYLFGAKKPERRGWKQTG